VTGELGLQLRHLLLQCGDLLLQSGDLRLQCQGADGQSRLRRLPALLRPGKRGRNGKSQSCYVKKPATESHERVLWVESQGTLSRKRARRYCGPFAGNIEYLSL